MFKKFWKAINGSVEKQDNPWAICTAQVGRENKEKYESCVMSVKQKLGIHKDVTEEEFTSKDFGVENAGDVPKSLLAEQDLESSTTEKAIMSRSSAQNEADRLMDIENDVQDMLGLRGGDQSSNEKYIKEILKRITSFVKPEVMSILEDENYHSLCTVLRKNGRCASRWDTPDTYWPEKSQLTKSEKVFSYEGVSGYSFDIFREETGEYSYIARDPSGKKIGASARATLADARKEAFELVSREGNKEKTQTEKGIESYSDKTLEDARDFYAKKLKELGSDDDPMTRSLRKEYENALKQIADEMTRRGMKKSTEKAEKEFVVVVADEKNQNPEQYSFSDENAAKMFKDKMKKEGLTVTGPFSITKKANSIVSANKNKILAIAQTMYQNGQRVTPVTLYHQVKNELNLPSALDISLAQDLKDLLDREWDPDWMRKATTESKTRADFVAEYNAAKDKFMHTSSAEEKDKWNKEMDRIFVEIQNLPSEKSFKDSWKSITTEQVVEEIQGARNYLELAEAASDSGKSETLETMADEELGHAQNLMDMKSDSSSGV